MLLCIQRADIDAITADTAGKVYADAVAAALAAGADRFSPQDEAAVRAARAAVRLDTSIARRILDAQVRKSFLGFVTRSRAARGGREEAGKALRELVVFSNVVAAPLLRDVMTDAEREADEKAEAMEKAQKEIAEIMAKAKAEGGEEGEEGEEGAAPATAAAPAKPAPALDAGAVAMSKADALAAAAAGKAGAVAAPKTPALDDGKRGQSGITLAADVPLVDRVEAYRTFLLWCLSGETVRMPMGGTMTVNRDASEFARLDQLASVLGLAPADVAGVQAELAEQAFRQQVQNAVGGGVLSPDRAAELEALRQKMGLPKDAADRVIKSVQAERVAGGLQADSKRGAVTLQTLLDMKDAGVDVKAAVGQEMRQALYNQELAARLANGRGDFDADATLTRLPADLGLAVDKCRAEAARLAKDKRRVTLVQAVSSLRQRDGRGAARALNNLLSCERAAPAAEPLQWTPRGELEGLYAAYLKAEADEGKREGVRALLGLTADEAARTASAASAGAAAVAAAAEEEEALF